MVGFTRDELEQFYDATVPDLLDDRPTKLLFVGINPGLWTAATQTHFAHPGNRFYPALWAGGVIGIEVDRRAGLTDEERDHLRDRGLGITNLVRRATARADELSAEELRQGGADLVGLVERVAPAAVGIVGITAYRQAFGAVLPATKHARTGPQPAGAHPFGDVTCHVLHNPSGLNAHATARSLAEDYRGVAIAAGVDVDPPRWDD